jgi:D-alanyl-D-alanine carboxypeptidase
MAATRHLRRNNLLRWLTPAALAAAAALIVPTAARAQVGSARYASIVVDARSGEVLESANPDALRHPASLAKVMTLYMTFEALRDRRITLNQLVPVSASAASMQPTKLGLVPGTKITVEQAILGLVTKSANDAAAALGELLGGSEPRFAQMMTLRARALGMSSTTFANASGLPAPDEWTTARDLAILARRLINDFPGYYHYFSTPSFVFQHRVIFNHDTMLKIYPGADGMKTGYTDASGHNLITSAVRGGVRLIGVVMGAASNGERDIHMASLLNEGFGEMDVPIGRRIIQAAAHPGLIASAHAATAESVHQVALHTRVATNWGIQVGSFSNHKAARAAAFAGRRIVDAGEAHVEVGGSRHHSIWRAQVIGLTARDAQTGCSALAHHRMHCMLLKPESNQLASR